MSKIKNLYARIMPSSKKQLNDKIEQLDIKLSTLEGKIIDITELLTKMGKEIEIRDAESEAKRTENRQLFESSINDNFKKQEENLKAEINNINEVKLMIQQEQKKLSAQIAPGVRSAKEAVWSSVFHDAIINNSWLEDQKFTPGRWAAGYPFLYALFRCMDEMKPQSILELGLGQTTKIIGQYSKVHTECHHIIVEHDEQWMKFFCDNFELPSNSKIEKMNLKLDTYKDDTKVLTYENFKQKVGNKKFDLISIDAPFGGEAIKYARIDILKIIPQCLAESFVIFLDDFNRKGEQNMIEDLKKILNEADIKYEMGRYWGEKDTCIIASEDLKFLCTL